MTEPSRMSAPGRDVGPIGQPRGGATAVLASLGLFQAANGATWSCYFAFAGILLREKFGLPVGSVAVLVSSCFLAYCVVQSLVSVLLDLGVRLVGLRRMLLRSPFAYGLGLVLLLHAPSPPAAVAALGVIGLGAASQPIVLALLFTAVPRHRSALAVSLLGLCYLVGQIAALAMGWYVVGHATVGIAFTVLALGWIALGALLVGTLRTHRAIGAPRARGEAWHRPIAESVARVRQQLIEPRTRALKALMFVAGVAPALAGIYVPLYLLSVVGDPGRSAGYIAASSAISYAVVGTSAPALGAFADRRNNHRQLLLGVLLFAALVLVALAHAREPVVASALSVCLAVGGQWLSVLLSAIQLLEVPPEATSTFFAANQVPFYVGSPLALSLGVGITAATGSVANTLLFVAGLFAAGACIWALHLMSSHSNPLRPRA